METAKCGYAHEIEIDPSNFARSDQGANGHYAKSALASP
jgi:hypothetical protein